MRTLNNIDLFGALQVDENNPSKINVSEEVDIVDIYEQIDVSKMIGALKGILFDVPLLFNKMNDDLSSIDKEISDILHVLELGSLNAVELTKMAVDLREARQKRRIIKDRYNEMRILMETIHLLKLEDLSKNDKRRKGIGDMINRANNVKKKQSSNRNYKFRIRHDLETYLK